jgi:hypothetical protein
MDTRETIESLVADFQKRKLWGALEFEFKAGVLVFIRKKETLQPSEKNSVGPRGENGANHRDFAAI